MTFLKLLQVGVRTEGIQEALLKMEEAPANTDRLAKMRQVIRVVSSRNPFSFKECFTKTRKIILSIKV